MRKTRLIAAAALATAAFAGTTTSAQAACGLTDCQQVSGTVASALSVTASSPVLIGNGTPGTLSLGGSAAPATGSGTVAVVSTTNYCLSVGDTGNDGFLTNALGASAGQFTNRLQWSSATSGVVASANTPAALRNTGTTGVPGTIASSAPNTLGKTFTIDYSLALAGQNVPAGVYNTTAQFSAQAC